MPAWAGPPPGATGAAGGSLPIGDHSTPADIRARFGASKKAFKQAIGALYRERRIELGEGSIRVRG
jgi:predicted RNA-binding protein (virulence factor B family)